MYKLLSILVLLGLLASSLSQGSLKSNSKQQTNQKNNGQTESNIEKREGCGWGISEGFHIQIDGITDVVKYGEFPWVVAILKVEPTNGSKGSSQPLVYIGGGSLIHPSVVLTTAHHVSDVPSSQLRARAGEWDTQTEKELYPHQDRDVKEVVVHKDFNKGNLFYDIGLLFLASPVELAPNVIGVACLPAPSVRAASGTRCLASGWPKDILMEGQALMKRVEATVVDRARCLQELRKTRLGSIFELHSSFMCAGAETEDDTCKVGAVAGGSPLVCPAQYEKDRYIQHGIVAWGIGCGPDTPVVYVDVGHLRSWIDDKVRGHGYDDKVYTYLD